MTPPGNQRRHRSQIESGFFVAESRERPRANVAAASPRSAWNPQRQAAPATGANVGATRKEKAAPKDCSQIVALNRRKDFMCHFDLSVDEAEPHNQLSVPCFVPRIERFEHQKLKAGAAFKCSLSV